MSAGIRRIKPGETWDSFPAGTRAYAFNGGWWDKLPNGWWKASRGDTLPTPGGDALTVRVPERKEADHE